MGLAASQARFLGITARKNACELRSMEIAQERLSVSNQLSQASQNYMTSLNATKLIWNPEYTDDYIFELDYDNMSRPSSFNNYQLQLLTNVRGQTVLDDSFYEALCSYDDLPYGNQFECIDGSYNNFDKYATGGIARTTSNFMKFIKALNAQGIITNAQMYQINAAVEYQNLYNTIAAQVYDPDNGFGSSQAIPSEIYSTDLIGLCNYIDNVTGIEGSSYLDELYAQYHSNPLAPTPYDNALSVISALNFTEFKAFMGQENLSHHDQDKFSIVQNAEFPQPTVEWMYDYFVRDHLNAHGHNPENIDWGETIYDSFNLADLIGRDDLALVGYGNIEYGYGMASESAQNHFVQAIDAFVASLRTIAETFFEYNGIEDESALDATIRIIENLYKDADGHLRTTDANYQSSGGNYMGGLPDYVNYCIPVKQFDDNNPNRFAISFSLSNLAQAFFTEYENQRSIGATGYNISTATGYMGDCHLITSDPNYVYDYTDVGTSHTDGDISEILNYYAQMFNQICVKGFVHNSAVGDSEKLQNMLKNGYLAVNTIGDDNYFYQYDYNAFTQRHGCFKEVADENAIALAEAEYKVKQAQLNAKEEELSVDMQNVEAELAALSTEYDTVKNLINKSVQKDFTTCGG